MHYLLSTVVEMAPICYCQVHGFISTCESEHWLWQTHGFCLAGPFFRSCCSLGQSPKVDYWEFCGSTFTGWMPFVWPNQQCHTVVKKKFERRHISTGCVVFCRVRFHHGCDAMWIVGVVRSHLFHNRYKEQINKIYLLAFSWLVFAVSLSLHYFVWLAGWATVLEGSSVLWNFAGWSKYRSLLFSQLYV